MTRTDELLARAIDAVRAAGDGDANDVAFATRMKLRRSLDHTAKRSRTGIVAIVMLMLGGTMAWAVTKAATATPPAEQLVPAEPEVAVSMKLDEPDAPSLHAALVVPEVAPPVPAFVEKPIAKPRPVEELYRKAHELHFHGGEPAVTLAAWDAYLAAEPAGRFAVEATFNRAIVLIRLGRYADAQLALAPFANGAVEPAGYRRDEAVRLIERLARVNGSR